MRWLVNSNGQTSGPMEEAMLAALVHAGQIADDAMVRKEAEDSWQPIAGTHLMAPETKPPSLPAAAPKTPTAGSDALGYVILAIPFFSGLLVWLWIANLNILQDPSGTLWALTLATIGATALLMSVEASQLAMGTCKDSHGKIGTGPVAWFLAACLMWLIAFPWYLAQRGRYGRKSLTVGGIFVALFFIGSAAAVGGAIGAQKTRIAGAFTGNAASLTNLNEQPVATPLPPGLSQLSPQEQSESARLQAFIDWHIKNSADLVATILPANRACYDKSDGELFGTCTGMHILSNGADSYSLNWIKARPQETLANYSTNHALNLDCAGLSTTEVRHFDHKWLQLVSFNQVCSGGHWGYLIEHYTAPSQSTKVTIYSADYPKYDKPFGRVLLGGD